MSDDDVRTIARATFLNTASIRLEHRRDFGIRPAHESFGEGRHFVGYEVKPHTLLGLEYVGKHRKPAVVWCPNDHKRTVQDAAGHEVAL